MTSTLGDRLTWRDGDVRMSQCAFCRHKARDATCAAFPAGIPATIIRNEVLHGESVEGDHGIRLDPIEIAEALFEHVTGLPWPAHAVSYDRLEALVARAHSTRSLDHEVATALMRAELLLPRTASEEDQHLAIPTIADHEGTSFVPLFTSIPQLEALYGSGTPRVRITLDNFPDGFGGIPIVVNPGSGAALTLDPQALRRLAST